MFIEKSISREIELIVDIAEDVPQELVSDPFRLKQVIANLTSNAFKFTKSGEIIISVSKKAERANGVELLFCVRDTGIGIPPESIASLFDAFKQADDSTTRKYGGTGLGLAICKNIVELFEGKIWVESSDDKGSSFYFTAFFKCGHHFAVENPLEIPPSLKNTKVLIVDDNASTLMVMKRFVESFGFKTILADSGESAIKLFKKSLENESIGLVLMDNRLPGIGGIDAAKTMKALSDKSPPIIIASAYGTASEINRSESCGFDRFMSKPVKQSQLFDTIMDVFGFNSKSKITRTQLEEENRHLKGLRILLVEDNAVNQMVAEEILSSARIKVDIAANGNKAVAALKKTLYDLVLMDVQMPEMDGFEATGRIRNELMLKEIPIIAMTAHAMYGDREKCLNAGMNDYISKPINRGDLFEVIKKNITVKSNLSFLAHKKKSSLGYSVPGLDIDDALKRFNGEWEMYLKILSKFEETFRTFAQDFRKILQTDDFSACRLKAHALKGAALNVSAQDLSLAAKVLENACVKASQESITQTIPAVENYLQIVFTSIEKLTGNKLKNIIFSPKPVNEFKFEEEDLKYEISNIIIELETNIDSADPVNIEKQFTLLKKKLPDGFKQKNHLIMDELEKFIILYKFDEAGDALKEVSTLLKNEFNN
jgi:CheY-like chemotaxis protein